MRLGWIHPATTCHRCKTQGTRHAGWAGRKNDTTAGGDPGGGRQNVHAGNEVPAEDPLFVTLARSGDKIAKPNQAVTCLLTSFVISNIVTWDLPLKTALRFASALMFRRFLAS